MNMPKPSATLSSTLLARKGHARPAMRSQGFGGFTGLADIGEDLGWNDMGQPLPSVLVEREALKDEIETPQSGPAAEMSVATAVRLQRETTHKGKAAFTLRLDQERHLKLRLATITRGRSAQQLVIAALDDFLTNLPEVESLVAQLPPRLNADRSKD